MTPTKQSILAALEAVKACGDHQLLTDARAALEKLRDLPEPTPCEKWFEIHRHRPDLRGVPKHVVLAIWNAAVEHQKESAWIPVEERLPENSDFVICCIGEAIGISWYQHQNKRWLSIRNDPTTSITHWQPFPEKPASEAGGAS